MGDKPCAFQDLRPFVNSLPPDQVTEFLNFVRQSVGLEGDQSPGNVRNSSSLYFAMKFLFIFECNIILLFR